MRRAAVYCDNHSVLSTHLPCLLQALPTPDYNTRALKSPLLSSEPSSAHHAHACAIIGAHARRASTIRRLHFPPLLHYFHILDTPSALMSTRQRRWRNSTKSTRSHDTFPRTHRLSTPPTHSPNARNSLAIYASGHSIYDIPQPARRRGRALRTLLSMNIRAHI